MYPIQERLKKETENMKERLEKIKRPKVEVIVPFKTPSVNHLYGINKGGIKYLKPEAKQMKEKIAEILSGQDFSSLAGATELRAEVHIYENWYTKKNTVKKIDIANREKFLIDAVFDAIGIDDKHIFEEEMKKIQSNEEMAVVRIIKLK